MKEKAEKRNGPAGCNQANSAAPGEGVPHVPLLSAPQWRADMSCHCPLNNLELDVRNASSPRRVGELFILSLALESDAALLVPCGLAVVELGY